VIHQQKKLLDPKTSKMEKIMVRTNLIVNNFLGID